MGIIIWLIVGGIVGWLASLIMKRDAQQGIILNVVVGIVGALLAGCERSASPVTFKSLDITGADYARQLALTDAHLQELPRWGVASASLNCEQAGCQPPSRADVLARLAVAAPACNLL